MTVLATTRLPDFHPALDDLEFSERRHAFHRAVYRSEPFSFDEVMRCFWKPPEGFVAHDHCILRALGQWHVFVLCHPLEFGGKHTAAVRAGQWGCAKQHGYAVGDTHLAGRRLTQLEKVGEVLTEPHGEWGTLAQTNSYVHRVDDRWALMYVTGGPRGQRLGLDWSDDLMNWQRDPHSPVWRPPDWAGGTNVCKGPCIVKHDERYFIYYNLNMLEGTSTVSLISTTDFVHFADHGPVLKFPFQYRGTLGCESPCVFERDGIWHLMVASGDAWWHAISNRPDGFMTPQNIRSATAGGVYDMGPFHVCKVFQHANRWWMTSSYKAEWRRRCRTEGRPIFRGEHDDERGVCEGLFITEIQWEDDRPVLTAPDIESM